MNGERWKDLHSEIIRKKKQEIKRIEIIKQIGTAFGLVLLSLHYFNMVSKKYNKMKKLILLVWLLHAALLLKAQMPRWIMSPSYDRIYLDAEAPVLFSDSLGVTSLWNLKGQRMATTADRVHPFTEGYAVVTAQDQEVLKGFYNTMGEFIALKDLSVAYSYPYFSNGFLLVNNNGFTQFVSPDGKMQDAGPYEQFYPFHRGLAVATKYKDAEKKKDLHYVYITTAKREIPFTLKEKPVDPEDVQFLSSVNEEGEGVAVIKEKVYFYNKQHGSLQPVFAGKDAAYQKKQLTLDGGEPSEYLIDMQDSLVLKTRAGKKEIVRFVFSQTLRPQHYRFMDYTREFKAKEVEPQKLPSSLVRVEDKSRQQVGLKCGDSLILPPQFDNVEFCFDHFAVIRQKDKWGMLLYDKSLKYRLSMHGGKAISFRHRDVTTNMKLELPALMSADLCRFEVDESKGCVLDKISIETKNTENGNYVAYQCNLTIPEGLPDVVTEIQYPVQITYDGLLYPVVPIKAKAWHYKYINVSLDDSEMKVGQGSATFAFDIHVDKQPGDDDYPFQLTVNADGLQPELTKISEIRYECKLSSLMEGMNIIQVNILEAGCPPSVFPFEIFYVKPDKRKGSRGKEEVRVGKLGTARELMNQPNEASAAVQTDSTRQDTAEPASAILQDLIPEVAPM